jgi:hypothetical protein
MTDTAPQRLMDHMRGVRYGEVLAVFLRDTGLEAEVYGTQMLNDCPQDLWETLNADAITKDMGAVFTKLNGPRYWQLDGLGSKVAVVDPVFRNFNGIQMLRIATIPMGADFAAGPYVMRNVNRGAVFFFDAGKTVYELVDPDGRALVMQARCIGVDPNMTEESLATLGDRLALPEGWLYRSRVLQDELVIDTSATLATVVQDEFENTYTLPY